MRMLMKVSIPIEAGNKAVKDGTISKIIGDTMERLHPEAAYFGPDEGKRTAYFFFDMKDSSQIPSAAEPFFMGLNAEIELTPVMNAEDLKTGLAALKR
jgi:hypothetical protein